MGQIRMLLAIGVVIVHIPYFNYQSIGYIGNSYVEAFVFASGFFICMVLSKTTVEYKSFFASRLLRIFPIYFISLFMIFAIKFLAKGDFFDDLNSLSLKAKFIVFLMNVTLIGSDWGYVLGLDSHGIQLVTADNLGTEVMFRLDRFLMVPPSWSLGMELTYYLVSLFLINRSKYFLFTLMFFSLVYRFNGEHLLAESLGVELSRPTSIAMFSTYLAGFLSFKYLHKTDKNRFIQMKAIKYLIFPIFVTTFVIVTVAKINYEVQVLLLLFQVLIATYFVRFDPIEQKLANFSYPLYILHFPLIESYFGLIRRVTILAELPTSLHLTLLSIILILLSKISIDSTSKIETFRKRIIRSS